MAFIVPLFYLILFWLTLHLKCQLDTVSFPTNGSKYAKHIKGKCILNDSISSFGLYSLGVSKYKHTNLQLIVFPLQGISVI